MNKENKPQTEAIDVPLSEPKRFVLVIETACEEFSVLDSLVEGRIQITTDGFQGIRAAGCIQMALAKSFVFHMARAYRISKHGRFLQNHRDQRRDFVAYLERIDLVGIRDVNEHGFDSGNPRRGGRERPNPSMHSHDLESTSVALDEISLIILDGKILIGPVNLYEVYEWAEKMRQIAGFGSIQNPR